MIRILALLAIVCVVCQGCALLAHQPEAGLTPTDVLAITRDTLIGVSHDVEAAHAQGLLTDEQYGKAKAGVLRAFHTYNVALEKFHLYGELVQADIDAVNELLASARGVLASAAVHP